MTHPQTDAQATGVLVRRIIQDQIRLHFHLTGRPIERQSTTVLPVPDGHGSTVTVRGQTNFTESPWAIYEGQYGMWQALVSDRLRVRPAHELG